MLLVAIGIGAFLLLSRAGSNFGRIEFRPKAAAFGAVTLERINATVQVEAVNPTAQSFQLTGFYGLLRLKATNAQVGEFRLTEPLTLTPGTKVFAIQLAILTAQVGALLEGFNSGVLELVADGTVQMGMVSVPVRLVLNLPNPLLTKPAGIAAGEPTCSNSSSLLPNCLNYAGIDS